MSIPRVSSEYVLPPLERFRSVLYFFGCGLAVSSSLEDQYSTFGFGAFLRGRAATFCWPYSRQVGSSRECGLCARLPVRSSSRHAGHFCSGPSVTIEDMGGRFE